MTTHLPNTMATSHDFASNYMVLVPQELGFLDLFRILWRPKIDKMEFVHSSKETEEYLQNRWVVFLSLLLQKILLLIRKRLAEFGSMFEFWLNLLSSNGGICRLLLNFCRGKMDVPKRESKNFMSICGYIDTRVELDRNIKPGDYRYFSSLSVMASKISYENKAFVKTVVEDRWKMELVGYYDFWNDFQGKHTTQALILHDKTSNPNIIVVAFRGTEVFDADAWCTDIDLSWYRFPGMGKIHGGFIKALGLQKETGWPKLVNHDDARPLAYYSIRKTLRELLKQNLHAKFLITGHSLGGALAILFPAVLALHEETWLLDRLHGIYTFGQPRVGNRKFNQFMETVLQKHGCKYFRFVYSNDIVPRLPTDDTKFMFKHFGTCLYFNSFYEGKEVVEEPYKNYFSSVFGAIPRYFIALWELARSFLIPYLGGPEYTETWTLKALRVIGLVFLPGISAHSIQDYVNLTMLGSHRFFSKLQDPFFTGRYIPSNK